jgi:pyruvate/2-oxoglutarate dehydrogenase complex dihydrolipoamide acyltransferase (E2) component
MGGPKAVSFALGSTVKKPVVRRDAVEIREMINMTVVFNHDIVDGAPAARFINRLRKLIEIEYEAIL